MDLRTSLIFNSGLHLNEVNVIPFADQEGRLVNEVNAIRFAGWEGRLAPALQPANFKLLISLGVRAGASPPS